MKKLILKSEKDTEQLAQGIVNQLKGGEVLALIGDLGAGKTTFTQYLAKHLGVTDHVNSPTFVLMKVYEIHNKHPLHYLAHLDTYRLSSEDELEVLGLDQYLNNPLAVVVIEWADKIPKFLQSLNKVIEIKFELGDNNIRKAIIKSKNYE